MDFYPSLKQRLASVLADESTADVTFLVGECKVPIRAHSQIVSSASDAFKNMLYGDFNHERAIEVPDGTPEGFRALLSYIYTGEVVPSIESVGSALYLANKYFVTGLCKDCIEFLKDSLDAANVCDFFEIAELFEELKEICDDVIRDSPEEVLKSEGFLRLSKDLMASVIARDDLASSEQVVYERTLEWAKRRLEGENIEANPTSIRDALGDALYLIRLPLMDVKAFSTGPAESGILTDKECLALYAWFASGKEPDVFCRKSRTPSAANINQVIEFQQLIWRNTCPHIDEKCRSVKMVIKACQDAKSACVHPTVWVCLHCLQTTCGHKSAGCGMRKHSNENQHRLFVRQALDFVRCAACWTDIAF